MSKLNARARKALSPSDFAIPPKNGKPGEYPIHDKGHAVAALARVDEFGTSAEKSEVRAAVARKFPDLPSSKGEGDSKTAKAHKGGK